MPTDLKELLRAFNDHGVKYLVVGGYAYGVHAEPRATKDLDIFIRSDQENSQAVFRALAQFGAPLDGLSIGDFMDGSTFQIGLPPARIDLMQYCPPMRGINQAVDYLLTHHPREATKSRMG